MSKWNKTKSSSDVETKPSYLHLVYHLHSKDKILSSHDTEQKY